MYPKGEGEIINIAGFMCHQIFRDLMLLENQLPFFVLNMLQDMTKQDDEFPLVILANYSFTFFGSLPNMIHESFRETECNAANNNPFFGNMKNLFDIKFENGLMTIPSFVVFDYTETFLRNFIAYEQQSSDVQSKYVSDFVIFMYHMHLIDSDKDVNLLCPKGIIKNWMKEDREVAELFNRIGNGIRSVFIPPSITMKSA
ncbi:hypothetical protein MTR67_016546 [Solanum verrucosum]|uniref:Uncharacterized protein n=1 Tax=Solanum verrucosum TaxID=315347 RepID=A0AAF0QH17_SOLVR|nr:hypothetical protein MTR67_016546 [Solanum verrucosum]